MIVIERESAYVDRLRNYLVILDGVKVGEIGNGKRWEFDVPPGDHILSMKIDWATSNELDFQAAKSMSIHFKCRSNFKGAKVWLAFFYAPFMFKRWIKLEQID